jgi:hypothetical protein
MILSVTHPVFNNSKLEQFFADNKNNSVWNLTNQNLDDQDMLIVAFYIKQNDKVREAQFF